MDHESLPEHNRLTDTELIELGIAEARLEGRMISDAVARVIASQMHGGMSTALYELASSGAINRERLVKEILDDYSRVDTPDEIKRWLAALGEYTILKGGRGPVAGWAKLWPDQVTDSPDRCAACGSHFSEAHAPGCPLDPDPDNEQEPNY